MNTRFGIGKVLAVGFRIWGRNLVPFVALTAVLHSPLIIWAIVLTQGRLDHENLQHMIRYEGASIFLVPLLNILVSAVLTYGVVMELQGQRVSIYACIATGFTRFFAALGTMILVCLCVVVSYVCGALLGAVGGGVVAAITGSLLALYIYSMFYVSTQAAVIDRPGVGGALLRSQVLTRGHRFALIALQLLLGAIAIGLMLAISAATRGDSFSPTRFRIWVYLDLARSVLIGSLGATLAGVAYYYLRAEKEGTSAAELAAIFD
jgi:hypothetical protein